MHFYQLIKMLKMNDKIDNEILKKYAETAYKEKNRFVLRKLIENIRNPEAEIINKYNSILSSDENTSDLMKGTVTIWVNKGIKVDKGVGTPDRSIGSGFFY